MRNPPPTVVVSEGDKVSLIQGGSFRVGGLHDQGSYIEAFGLYR